MTSQKTTRDQTNTNQLHTESELRGICQIKAEMRQLFFGVQDQYMPGKDSHLCLIVCFTSSSEHTISNRLNAGPLTQTGFPDGGRLFHSTGKQQGVEGWRGFFADGVGNCSYMPHPDEDEDGSCSQSQMVCLYMSHQPGSYPL